MKEAIKQAAIALEKGEVPVGAVVVWKNKIVARAYNQMEMLHDPTAHAEMIALTQASETLSQTPGGEARTRERAPRFARGGDALRDFGAVPDVRRGAGHD